MENRQNREAGKALCQFLYIIFEPSFATEGFYNAVEIKRWLGQEIKSGLINGYRNLEYKDYKAIFDLILSCGDIYHVGVDFGQQGVHVTLGPGDVYSLYYRMPCEPE